MRRESNYPLSHYKKTIAILFALGAVILASVFCTTESTRIPNPTTIPDNAGASEWLYYVGEQVGVREIAWDKYLSSRKPDKGKIYLSIYVVAINNTDVEVSFYPSDFGVVDGGGEVHGRVIFAEKEPRFSPCIIRPGGTCEGWWTTQIWDRPDVKEDLLFQWTPDWFINTLETPIIQGEER